MDIKYVKIQSSNIIGYFHDVKKKELYIQFGNGREYKYSDVSLEEVTELLSEPSFGKALREKIISEKKCEEI